MTKRWSFFFYTVGIYKRYRATRRTLLITSRKQSCGKVMFYTCLSGLLFTGGGGLCKMSPVLSGCLVPSSFRGILRLWCHVPSRGLSVSDPMFLLRGSLSLAWDQRQRSLRRNMGPETETPWTKTPLCGKEQVVCILLEYKVARNIRMLTLKNFTAAKKVTSNGAQPDEHYIKKLILIFLS